MGEYKGRGIKGRSYDELSGVGTSSAGITGTTGNLNTGGRDGGIGEPPYGDSGNRQTADRGQSEGTPALGKGGRAGQSRQGAQGSGSRSGSTEADQNLKDEQASDKPEPPGGSQSR